MYRQLINVISKVTGRFRHRTFEFGNQPENLRIRMPATIRGGRRVFIGNDVFIGPNSIVMAITETQDIGRHPDEEHVEQTFDPKIEVGHRVSVTGRLQLAAHKRITIGNDVMIASNVFLSDALHAYDDGNRPYKYQGMSRVLPIVIEDGCWIGQNVVVMPGVTIGRLSIIGANSVVTRSIPERCIAVGAPAKVIKRWSDHAQSWLPEGEGQKARAESGADSLEKARHV